VRLKMGRSNGNMRIELSYIGEILICQLTDEGQHRGNPPTATQLLAGHRRDYTLSSLAKLGMMI